MLKQFLCYPDQAKAEQLITCWHAFYYTVRMYKNNNQVLKQQKLKMQIAN